MDCVKDTDLHMDDTLGPGRPVVLIHGWPLPGVFSFDQKGMARWPSPFVGAGRNGTAPRVPSPALNVRWSDAAWVSRRQAVSRRAPRQDRP